MFSCVNPPAPLRRFMLAGGLTIFSHLHTYSSLWQSSGIMNKRVTNNKYL